MEFCLRVGIFIFLFFGRCYVYETTVGHFRLLHRHSKAVSCAAAVLRQNKHAGARISNLKGVCEGLPYNWASSHGVQSGYSYIKKMVVKEDFKPPLKVNMFAISRTIPGIFQNGAKIEVTITMPEDTPIYMDLKSAANDTIIPLMIENVKNFNRKFKVSFVSEGAFIKILLNGDERQNAEPLKPARLVRRLLIRTDTPMLESRTTLSRFMFTGE